MVAFSKDEKQKQQRCNNPSLPREYLKALELLGVEARHSHGECERCNPGGSFSPSELQQYSFSTSARVVGDSMGGVEVRRRWAWTWCRWNCVFATKLKYLGHRTSR